MPKVAIIFGTRPEAVKLAPVILRLQHQEVSLQPVICVTGQHRSMLDQVLQWFGIRPDHDLNLMTENQTLAGLSASLLTSVSAFLQTVEPDLVMVQGDTTTAAMAGLAAFYARVPVAHVEAGLRTGDRFSPFPEEANRRILSNVAEYHFAPTQAAAKNLLAEGLDDAHVIVTGNTVVDALQLTLQRSEQIEPPVPKAQGKLVLVTAHRRESFGAGFESICRAIRILAERQPAIDIVYPVHLNPNVREPVERLLRNVKGVYLIEPVSYEQMAWLLSRSELVLTDSGGIQEEACVLDKPTLVLRDTTERAEAVGAGTALLVGTDPARIVDSAEAVLNGTRQLRRSGSENPFGDGQAARRIVDILENHILKNQLSML